MERMFYWKIKNSLVLFQTLMAKNIQSRLNMFSISDFYIVHDIFCKLSKNNALCR